MRIAHCAYSYVNMSLNPPMAGGVTPNGPPGICAVYLYSKKKTEIEQKKNYSK